VIICTCLCCNLGVRVVVAVLVVCDTVAAVTDVASVVLVVEVDWPIVEDVIVVDVSVVEASVVKVVAGLACLTNVVLPLWNIVGLTGI